MKVKDFHVKKRFSDGHFLIIVNLDVVVMMSPENQRLCEILLLDDEPGMKHMFWGLDSGKDEMDEVFAALKQNKTVEKVCMFEGFSLHMELSLASTLLVHPELTELEFSQADCDDLVVLSRVMARRDKMARLTLFESHIESVEGICYLLNENRIESLSIGFCNIENAEDEIPKLVQAIQDNTSLKKLIMNGQYGDPEAVGQGVSSMLVTNQMLESLELHLEDVPNESEIVASVAIAATSHPSLTCLSLDFETELNERSAEAICHMLRNTPGLCDFSVGPGASRHLTEGLRIETSGLEKLDLSNSCSNTHRYPGVFGSQHLVGLLEGNTMMKFLDLRARRIGDSGAHALADGLKKNSVLKELKLSDNEIGIDGITAISDALCSNTSLKKLILYGNANPAGGVCQGILYAYYIEVDT